MRSIWYDKPVQDTFEIEWEMNKDIFIEKIFPMEGKTYYQSHMYKECIKSKSFWDAFIAMWLLWNNCRNKNEK